MMVKLLKTLQGVGRIGEIVEVSDAQARNFMLPKKIAVLATGTVVQASQREAAHDRVQRVSRQEALTRLIQKVEQGTLRLRGTANEQGKLFAAIKTPDIQAALEQQFGMRLDHIVCQPDHLKTVGTHHVQLMIDRDHRATIHIEVEHGS